MEFSDLLRHQHDLTDSAFLDEFDTSLPGLEAVAVGLETGDLPVAKLALVNHMRTRLKPRWVFDARAGNTPPQMLFHLWPPRIVNDREEAIARADLLFSNQFTITEGIVLDFGPNLDWVTELISFPLSPAQVEFPFFRLAFLKKQRIVIA